MMVESVNVKAEGSVFSIKKGKILSGLIPHLKLPYKPLSADIEDQIVERKKEPKNGDTKNGAKPHFFLKIENRKKKIGFKKNEPVPILHFFRKRRLS